MLLPIIRRLEEMPDLRRVFLESEQVHTCSRVLRSAQADRYMGIIVLGTLMDDRNREPLVWRFVVTVGAALVIVVLYIVTAS